MQPWQERVRTEHYELMEKIEKLEAFMEGHVFEALIEKDRLLLHRQLLVMNEYRAILEERLARLLP